MLCYTVYYIKLLSVGEYLDNIQSNVFCYTVYDIEKTSNKSPKHMQVLFEFEYNVEYNWSY